MSLVLPSATEHSPTWKFGFPIYHALTRAQWRAWLEANHATAKGVWLCSYRSATGKPAVPYVEAVLEVLCFGWIDSTASVMDEERSLQLMTPRKPKSSWTRLNRQRVAEMEAAGLMTDAGRRVVDAAKASGWWMKFDPVEDLLEPTDLAIALDANPTARTKWNAFPPSARKVMLWWVITAERPDTTARRIATIVEKAERGERAQG